MRFETISKVLTVKTRLVNDIKTFRVELIHDANRFYKFASVWVFFLIGCMPDFYNGIASMGWADEVPGPLKWSIRGLAAAGVAARVLKRKIPDIDETDRAGA